MERAEVKIDQKYIDMAERFKAMQKDRKHSIQRFKMIMKYEVWYKDHVEKLTKAEREYLQKNIIPVSTYLDEEETSKNTDLCNEE